MFTKRDVANYYNATQLHYENWWGLKKTHSLHYGIWENGIHTAAAAIANTNKILMELAGIKETDYVLDAGCGVGGAAIYISTNKNARVCGITLSEKQLAFANGLAKEKNVEDKVAFRIMDYTNTEFADETFDVVWACESMTHAMDKKAFIAEAYRVLKKGGRLIISDFFLSNDNQVDKRSLIKKWIDTWFINELVSGRYFTEALQDNGFSVSKNLDYTSQIYKSAKRLYFAALLGALPAGLYNLFHPKVSAYSKNHYKCGYYQYKALKKDLWQYRVILAEK
ncbi:MAG: methyltransferase domain-containing protein [Ferruginibacter sp.]